MKSLILGSLLVVSACGKVALQSGEDFSTTKSLNPVVMAPSSNEYQTIKEICRSIETKSITISSLVGTTYTFSQASKKCDDSGLSDLSDATVTLVNQGGSFKFSENNNLFYFSDVETKDVGVLNQVCAGIASNSAIQSPIELDQVNLLYFTARDISSSDCANSNNELCILVEKAVRDNTSQGPRGRVHTREWLKIKTEQPLEGFFTYRKLSSIGGCLEGSFFSRTATLK